ncbi:sensor histidine kinase [Kineosporia succinea]|uniref:histidine kinase n=1 Tax=Kineosporia succinea TaxID=84632 RepID=A0ABT9PCB9_9ACTN|nr:histidine kinase [Kineosporia succinea]MDP9830132.1 signal transduction histidine kinase [Kineosporia succinea]
MQLSVADHVRRATARHPHLVDLATASVLVLLILVAWVKGPTPAAPAEPQPLPALLFSLGLTFSAVSLRGFRPRLVAVASAAAYCAFVIVTGSHEPALVMAQPFVAYTLALKVPRTTARQITGVAALTMYLVDAVVVGDSLWHDQSIGILLWTAVGLAAGEATRNRRAYIAAVEERARRAEQTREDEARRRVMQERVRIARELHDVVAHHIAVINVQAGAVSHLLDRRPEAIRPAVNHIREACDTVLTELSSIVGVLRQPGDPLSTEPAPGLHRLPDLLESMAAAGLAVDSTTRGHERDLPAVTDLAAYRVIQEALTNAHKYGTGRTRLEIGYGPQEIAILVTNELGARVAGGPGPEGGGAGSGSSGWSIAGPGGGQNGGRVGAPGLPAGGGYGLIGMSERVAAAQGALTTRITDEGQFVVEVAMPVPAPVTPPVTEPVAEPVTAPTAAPGLTLPGSDTSSREGGPVRTPSHSGTTPNTGTFQGHS